jgi:hypothetical protein
MTDEIDNPEELGDVEIELEGDAEYVECEKGQIVFPHGTAWYADTHGFNALFIEYKTGAITGEDNETGLMRTPSRKRGTVTAITPKGTQQ